MLQVGLTGGIACGKTTVSELFAKHGAPVIDADILAREVVVPGSEGLSRIVATFGDEVLASDGTLDRGAMRQLIFSNQQAKYRLEGILHPLIRKRMSKLVEQLAGQDFAYCIKAIPLLLETNQQDSVDRILVIDCDEDTQVRRIVSRDSCTESDARKIISSQISRSQRLSSADDTVINNAGWKQLEDQVEQLHQFYTRQALADR
jgi:dephospho-CoA kinase